MRERQKEHEVTITANGRVLVKETVKGKVTWKKKAELYAEALTSIIGDCSMTINETTEEKKE